MPSLETLVAAILFGGLTLYVLSGGADFGGGVWDIFASGPRRQEQRDLIADAVARVREMWRQAGGLDGSRDFPSGCRERLVGQRGELSGHGSSRPRW